ncbi:MAG TPA: hypothetical protein ENH59_08280 [Bacteroidetes bacterium]|nr:hypothetical protein [Bacteroidota bacterium]
MKRNIVILITILFIFSNYARAQESYIGFSLGTSIPGGDFAAAEHLFNNGYAIPGFTVSFEGYYFPLRFIGIGGVLGFGSLYAESDNYLDDLIEYAYTQPGIPVFGSPPLADDIGFESGFWNYINLMAGPELSVPFGRFRAGIRGLAGLTLAFYPKREFYYSEGSNILEINVNGPSAAFTYSYGASLLYKSRAGTGIKVSADYLSSKASYDFNMEVITSANEYNHTRREDVDLEALSITLGFFYVF